MIKNELKSYAEGFEKRLETALEATNGEYRLVADACKYSLLLGGKRLRPFLLNRFYKLCGGKDGLCVNFEKAIECIHTYSLIHDDLPCMDNDDMRRGKPSCHKKFGEEYALLAGDALLTEAFGLAASSDQRLGSKNILDGIKILSTLAGINGMIGGQTVDLLYEKKTADENILRLICNLKTGALITCACLIGCTLAGADEERKNAAKTYAEKLGLAFQITDDILDETGCEEKLGKPIHSDQSNSKSTFVTLYGIDKCKKMVAELTEEAKRALDVFGSQADELKSLADYLCNRDY